MEWSRASSSLLFTDSCFWFISILSCSVYVLTPRDFCNKNGKHMVHLLIWSRSFPRYPWILLRCHHISPKHRTSFHVIILWFVILWREYVNLGFRILLQYKFLLQFSFLLNICHLWDFRDESIQKSTTYAKKTCMVKCRSIFTLKKLLIVWIIWTY